MVLLPQGLAVDAFGNRDAEVLEYGRRDVDDVGRGRGDRTIGDQHTGRGLVVEAAVVARPLLVVVVDDALGCAAERGLPRDAIAVIAPADARPAAMAAPRPLEPPVTMATCPFIRNC